MSSRAYNRYVSYKKAIRKRNIDRYYQSRYYNSSDYYDNLHQYSKNKIHCSCCLCSTKTRNKGHRRYKRGNYYAALNYKASDMRKINRLNYIEDYDLIF